MDGGPAHHKYGDHHQHQTSDPAEVAVLLARAREQAHALQPHDHQRVADGDDDDGGHKGEDEDTYLHQGVPVDVGFRELEGTLCGPCQNTGCTTECFILTKMLAPL